MTTDFTRERDGELRLYINPIEIYVWKDLKWRDEKTETLDEGPKYEYLMHYGSSSVSVGNFDREEGACADAIAQAIRITETVLAELKQVRLSP